MNDNKDNLESKNTYLKRWEDCKPDSLLTWGKILTGDAFIELANSYKLFSPDRSIIELGPGYGRISKSLFSKRIPFKKYVGIDLSPNNVDYLEKEYGAPNIKFIQGAFSSVRLSDQYDIVISSLTLKHQFPTFFEALKNISGFISKGGIFFFDLLENKNSAHGRKATKEELLRTGPAKSGFEGDVAYVGSYLVDEVKVILQEIPLTFIASDHVIHSRDVGERLIILAKKP